MKTGILLTNIGTPASYHVADVKNYLKTFLMDEDIINIPWPIRWILVHFIIVPKRASASAENYKKIWTDQGSPLLTYTKSFAEKLQIELGDSYAVEFGMSYSEPSIEEALKRLQAKGVDKVLVAPMYPQFAQATTGSAHKAFKKAYKNLALNTPYQMIEDFYATPEFIKTQAQIARTHFQKSYDHYVFSFHGLPESQIKRDSQCKLSADCCSLQTSCDRRCYRAQCFKTANLLAKEMNLGDEKWTVTFQSRLGKTEWIKPYTDATVEKLAQSGTRRLAMLSPAFVTDCIETLEELAIGVQESFLHHGGSEFSLSPCVNDHDTWVQGFAQILRRTH